jgi:hypothetical protein
MLKFPTSRLSVQISPGSYWLLGLAAVAIFTLGLLFSSTPYLHDFGEWMFQGKVIALKLSNPGLVSGYQLAPYPVPNSLATLILAILNLIFSPLAAGKVFLLLLLTGWCVVGWTFCTRYFEEAADSAKAWLLLLCVAGFSSFFWYGFVAYQLGALLFLAFLARYRTSTGLVEIALMSVVIFFSHAMMFLQFGLLLLVAVLIAGFPARHLIALVPSTLLSAWFLAGRLASGTDPGSAAAQWAGLFEVVVYKFGTATMLGPFKNFILPDGSALLESLPALYWTGVAANVIVTALLGLLVLVVLVKQFAHFGLVLRTADQRTALQVFSLLTAVFFVVAPHDFFGMENPGVRMLLPLLFASIALLPSTTLRLPAVGVLFVAVVTIGSVSAYSVSLLRSDGPTAAFEKHEAAPEDVRASVLKYNEWLYRHTRYSYYNYRVFAFERRLNQLRNHDYTGLGFKTGLLVAYLAKTEPGPEP